MNSPSRLLIKEYIDPSHHFRPSHWSNCHNSLRPEWEGSSQWDKNQNEGRCYGTFHLFSSSSLGTKGKRQSKDESPHNWTWSIFIMYSCSTSCHDSYLVNINLNFSYTAIRFLVILFNINFYQTFGPAWIIIERVRIQTFFIHISFVEFLFILWCQIFKNQVRHR